MKTIIILLFVVLPVVLTAQSKRQGEKIHYTSSQTGVGVALDPYGFRTVPLFYHLNYTMYPQKNSVYVYGDAGVSIPWNNGALPEKYDNSAHDGWHKLFAGFYGEASVGYNILLNKKGNAITINAGYSYKRFKYDENVYIWNGFETVQQKDHYIFDYRRLVFRLGFSL